MQIGEIGPQKPQKPQQPQKSLQDFDYFRRRKCGIAENCTAKGQQVKT